MQQILFRIPGLGYPVYGYGLMMVLGFFAGALVMTFLARRKGFRPEVFMNAALLALVAGVVGARASHVLENLGDFTRGRATVTTWNAASADRVVQAPHSGQYTLYTPASDQPLASASLREGQGVGFEHAPDGAAVAVAGDQRIPLPPAPEGLGGAAVGGRWDRAVSAGENLLAMVNVRNGGLTFYGGFLLAFPVLVLYALYLRVPLGVGMDIVAPALMVAYGFGRLGCFLNGCCYGAECQVPWAVQYPYHSIPYVEQYQAGKLGHAPDPQLLKPNEDLLRAFPGLDARGVGKELKSLEEINRDPHLQRLAAAERSAPVHPAQLYSAFTAFLLAGLLLAYFTLPHAPGRVFALMCILEGSTRFLLEMLRVEPPVIGRLSLSMAIGLGVVAVGVGLWLLFGHLAARRAGPGLSPAARPA